MRRPHMFRKVLKAGVKGWGISWWQKLRQERAGRGHIMKGLVTLWLPGSQQESSIAYLAFGNEVQIGNGLFAYHVC